MYTTKYGVSLKPSCFKSSPRSPAPQLSAQIFNCPARSAVRWCSGHNLGILGRGPLGPFCGWGTLVGPCGCRSWLRTCSESCSSGSVLAAGGCRARWCSLSPWRVARVTPGGSWIHGSGPLHRRTADRGHSFSVASKISHRLLWWPPTEHQCVLIYRCVFTYVCCWLFSVGNKVTTTTTFTKVIVDTNLIKTSLLIDKLVQPTNARLHVCVSKLIQY